MSHNAYKIKIISASSSNPLELNNCKNLYTTYKWDYEGYKYVTCGGVAISSSAGTLMIFPSFGGVTQVFVQYNKPIIKVRVSYYNTWSSWYEISTSESSL